MDNGTYTAQGFIDGKPCVIGRDAHVKIDDPSLSRGHADIRFVDGKIILRDLESTNGTYLDLGGQFEQVTEAVVYPGQIVALGSKKYRIKALMAQVGIFLSYSEDVGLVIEFADSDQETITVETDLDELVSETISKLYK